MISRNEIIKRNFKMAALVMPFIPTFVLARGFYILAAVIYVSAIAAYFFIPDIIRIRKHFSGLDFMAAFIMFTGMGVLFSDYVLLDPVSYVFVWAFVNLLLLNVIVKEKRPISK